MLKEALSFLTTQAEKAAKSTVEDRGHYLLIRGPEGDVDCKPVLPPPRDHIATCLESLAAAVAVWDARSTVWVGHGGITAVLTDDPHIGRVDMLLTRSRQLDALIMRATESMDQRAFCRFLRLDLDLPPETIAPYRKLTWTAGEHGAGRTTHTKESLGREVYAELTNAGGLSETITVNIPLYDVMGQRDPYAIRCNVDIDTASQTLRLDPAPAEIQKALDAHAKSNAAWLATALGEKADVLLGTPGRWATLGR